MLTRSTAPVLFLAMLLPLGVFAQEEDGWGFVPGDKLLLFDDYADMLRGGAPEHWKVRGAAVRLMDGRLTFGAGSSTRMTPNLTTWPDDFTIEMDLQGGRSADDAMRNLTWVFEMGDSWIWQATLALYAGGACQVTVDIADPGENSRAACNWLPDGTNNVALWVQDDRLRIYVNGQRLIDLNQLRLSFQTASLMVSADTLPVSFGPFRIAQTTADASTKIYAGGSKAAQGIQSDFGNSILSSKSNPLEIQKLDPNALRQPSITITTPKSGDTMATGSTYPISWEYQRDAGPVKIELAAASGGATLWIAPSVSLDGSGIGQYNWQIFENLSPANNYIIKVISLSNSALSATTGPFSIVRPSITLTSPQQGAAFPKGGSIPIKWSYAGNNLGDQVRVTATLEGSVSPSLDAMYVPLGKDGQGEYSQWIPPASGDNQKFRIRVQSIQNPSIFSEAAISVVVTGSGGGQQATNTQPSSISKNKSESTVERPTASFGNSNAPLDIRKQLFGYVDLHAHPMSYLGFGRKAMFGGLDIGSVMPAGSKNCSQKNSEIANSVEEALGNCNAMHGGWGQDNTCGDYIREGIINIAMEDKFVHRTSGNMDHEHSGYPDFLYWPNQTSILHQQMWWEWIKRAYEGGLRVMVALTVNSELLAEVINGDPPYDDKSVADFQIDETIKFVNRHSDFMEIAYSAADLNRIVNSNKLAVILGMEVDKLGNFGKTGVTTDESAVRAEIQRLYRKGIRYAFPIHLINNSFGGTAIAELLFNFANKQANGRHFQVVTSNDPNVAYKADLVDGVLGAENRAIWGIRGVLEGLGELPAPCFNDAKCLPLPGKIRCCGSYEKILNVFNISPELDIYKFIPGGHVNSLGLTQLGTVAINEMMKLGMLIDVDHMSESATTRVIEIAEKSGNYPLLMGHNRIRESNGTERDAPEHLVKRIGALGGMFGVGTADLTPDEFVNNYRKAFNAMGNGAVAIGTDADGFEPLPKHMRAADDPTSKQFYAEFFNDPFIKTTPITAKSGISDLSREWDYIKEKGVAQYGLMPEFLFDAKTSAAGNDVIDNLMQSAEHFGQLWQKAEMISKSISGAPLAGTYSNSIEPIMNLCPSGLAGGDREFDGNGPKVTGMVKLQISPDGTNLQAVISFDAIETVSNWSEVKGDWTIDIGEPAPAGMRYSKITSSTVSTFERVLSGGGGTEIIDGCDGAEHVIMPASGPVSSIFVVGDTGGEDISTDDDCACDTRIKRIDFKPINATLVER